MSSTMNRYANITVKVSTISADHIKKVIRRTDYSDAQISYQNTPKYTPCSKGVISRQIPYTTFIKFAPKEFVSSLPKSVKFMTVSFYSNSF